MTLRGRHGLRDPGQARAVIASAAAEVVRRLTEQGRTVVTAESLTGGMLGAALTAVPGASSVYRGGVVAYATDLKEQLLGVDAGLLKRVGAVDGAVAASMAVGARQRLGADYGLAVTGVAGPDPQDGHPVGTVWLGLAGPRGAEGRDISSDPAGREQVRLVTTALALLDLGEELRRAEERAPSGG